MGDSSAGPLLDGNQKDENVTDNGVPAPTRPVAAEQSGSGGDVGNTGGASVRNNPASGNCSDQPGPRGNKRHSSRASNPEEFVMLTSIDDRQGNESDGLPGPSAPKLPTAPIAEPVDTNVDANPNPPPASPDAQNPHEGK